MIVQKLVVGCLSFATATAALAGTSVPLGARLGLRLGHVLGLPMGSVLPVASGGLLVVAAISLVVGIGIVRRKRAP